MSLPRSRMDMNVGQRYRAMPVADARPRSTLDPADDMDNPFTMDDMGNAMSAVMGAPMPAGAAGAMSAGITGKGLLQALRARLSPQQPTGPDPFRNGVPDSWGTKGAPVPPPAAPPPPPGSSTVPMRPGMQRTPVPPAGMPKTSMVDDLPPLPGITPEQQASMKMGFKYDGPDLQQLARRYDDEWWDNLAKNPPPPMRMGPEEPLDPLPPAEPGLVDAIMARIKTAPPEPKTVAPPRRGKK